MLLEEEVLTLPISPPTRQELPSAYATRLAVKYASLATTEHKKAFGQFFTPLEIGAYLASLTTFTGPEARLLDPGIGTGVLACALAEHLAHTSPQLTRIHLDAYDVDEGVQPYTQAALAYLTAWLNTRQIVCQTHLIPRDFITEYATLWSFPLAQAQPLYDVVISNPPYFKLSAADPRNALARQRQQDQPNIYALFIVQAILLAKPGGELVFIIPRSFCSGPYFERFRSFAFEQLRFDVFHLFHSRTKAFKKDAVLQENMIFKATRARYDAGHNYPIQVIASEGTHDLSVADTQQCTIQELVDFGSKEKVLFLPTSGDERTLIAEFKTWRHRLKDFGLEVSTGPVVAFRSVPYLHEAPGEVLVPLLWIDHVRRNLIDWPNARGRHQYIAQAGGKRAGLIPSKNYVLLRRFSAKDDKHRLIAAAYYADEWPQYDAIGLENKLNYIYSKVGEFTIEQVTGLTALLNSNLYDAFFRIFNGNTQVSATEARALPMPPLALIEQIGRRIQGKELDELDAIVNDVLHNPMTGNLFESEATTLTPDKQKISESTSILAALGMPRAQLNDRSALTLLALLDLKPTGTWQKIHPTMMGVTPIMDWCRDYYDTTYAPNTRETFRRQTLHQFIANGLVTYNADEPERAVNSPKANYLVTPTLQELLKKFGTETWSSDLATYLKGRPTLIQQYANERAMTLIPLRISSEIELKLSTGAHSKLISDIITEFAPRFAPDSEIIYIGDTGPKTSDYFQRDRLAELGVEVDKHGKMPDVVLYFPAKNWLLLIESVTSHGPVDGKRHKELYQLFAKHTTAGLVYVTAFPDKRTMGRYVGEISWETEVWVAEAPTHMIHFNGVRFLGPYGNNPAIPQE